MNVLGLVSLWGVLPATDEWYAINILACDTSDPNQIAIADGWASHDHGSTLTASEILPRQWYRQKVEDGRYIVELEPPGWFERRCALLKCSWFHALVRRMAAGDVVTFEEIKEAYRKHNGCDIPIGTWSQLAIMCAEAPKTR